MSRFDEWCMKRPLDGLLVSVLIAIFGMSLAFRLAFPHRMLNDDLVPGFLFGLALGVAAFQAGRRRKPN